MQANGTAVVLVNVARRSNRRGTCPVRPGHCPGARRAWRVFLQSGHKVYCALVRSRYKFDRWLKISHGSRMFVNGHMRSIALHVVRKPENGHDILKLNYVQMRESGCINHYVTVMLAASKGKNRDKFIDTTDRVRFCCESFTTRLRLLLNFFSNNFFQSK